MAQAELRKFKHGDGREWLDKPKKRQLETIIVRFSLHWRPLPYGNGSLYIHALTEARPSGSDNTGRSLVALTSAPTAVFGLKLDLLSAKAKSLRSSYYPAFVVSGRYQMAFGNLEQAVKEFSEAVRLVPTDEEGWQGLVEAHLAAHQE